MTTTETAKHGSNPIGKISAAFAISFLFMVLVAIVVGTMSSKIRTVAHRIISNDLAKMVLIDQVSRDVSLLHLHVFQYMINDDAADAAKQVVAIRTQLEINSRHIEQLRTMLDREREVELFDNAMRLRAAIAPRITDMMQTRMLANQPQNGTFYDRQMRIQTDQFLDSLFALSKDIGAHTKEKGKKTLDLIASTRHLVFALIFVAILVGGIKAWSLYIIAVQLQTDKRLLSEETARTQVASKKIFQLENALDNADDIIVMFDGCRKFVYANQGALTKLGYSETEIHEIDPISLYRPGEGINCEEILANLKGGQSPSIKMETYYQRKNGSTFPAEIMLQYVGDENDGVFVNIARDISERKEVERLKDEFVSVVSHELRTPLTSIRGALGILASGQAGELPQDAKGMVTIASSNCERLVRLIGDILDLEKIEAGKMEFNFVPCDLRKLVGEAVDLNQSYAGNYHVSLVADPGPVEASSRVDADRILQVLTNLISNAVKYSPSGGAVKVQIEAQAKAWRIKVIDQGSGIPANFRDKVFSKFAQAEAALTRKKGGTGLGLSIVKMITERHGGAVGFTSEEGHGTTFFVDLPHHATAQREAAPASNPKKLLVCEGNPETAAYLSSALAKAGFQAVIAATAADAIQLARETQLDAIAIDLSSPDKETIGLLREIRSRTTNALLPVIVLSTYDETTKVLSQPIRIVDWMEIPIDTERLAGSLMLAKGSQSQIQILHIEDDPDVVHVISAVLEEVGVVTPAATAAEAIHKMSRGKYDIILLDLDLGEGPHAGVELLETIRAMQGDISVVVFSAHEVEREWADKVQGVLLKSKATNDEFTAMVRQLLPRPAGIR